MAWEATLNMQSLLSCESQRWEERGKEDHLLQCTPFWHRTPKEGENSKFDPSLPGSKKVYLLRQENIIYFIF